MANTYKNIVITPNRDTAANVVPLIRFSGGDGTSNTDINVRVYTTSNGTLSFEGSAGQLFSITNDLSNVIFSVNDVSGIPSLEIDSNGKITLAQYGGNVGIGTATPLHKLDVAGGANISSYLTVAGSVGIGNTAPTANLQVSGNVFVTLNNASSLSAGGEIAEFAHNSNSYVQVHIRNANTGTKASADLVVTADNGTDTTDFIDLGINNSNFNETSWTINGAKDGYLYTSNGHLPIGTANTNQSIIFFSGGRRANNERMGIPPPVVE